MVDRGGGAGESLFWGWWAICARPGIPMQASRAKLATMRNACAMAASQEAAVRGLRGRLAPRGGRLDGQFHAERTKPRAHWVAPGPSGVRYHCGPKGRTPMNRRNFSSCAGAMLALAGLLSAHACGQEGAKEPIKVGHYGSLSGSEATFGESTDRGIRLAIQELNAAGGVGGRRVELI